MPLAQGERGQGWLVPHAMGGSEAGQAAGAWMRGRMDRVKKSPMSDQPLKYVALGDSTAVGVGAASGGGYPERLQRRFETAGISVSLLNLGVSGALSQDVLQRQVHMAVA